MKMRKLLQFEPTTKIQLKRKRLPIPIFRLLDFILGLLYLIPQVQLRFEVDRKLIHSLSYPVAKRIPTPPQDRHVQLERRRQVWVRRLKQMQTQIEQIADMNRNKRKAV